VTRVFTAGELGRKTLGSIVCAYKIIQKTSATIGTFIGSVGGEEIGDYRGGFVERVGGRLPAQEMPPKKSREHCPMEGKEEG